MRSRSKKKHLWREEKERRCQVEKGFYDMVINTVEQLNKDYKDGKFAVGVDLAKGEDQTVYSQPN